MKVEKLEKYTKVEPEEGMVLTTFKDGDNILDYTSATKMFAPHSINLDEYREISIEEDEKYIKEQLEEIQRLGREQTK